MVGGNFSPPLFSLPITKPKKRKRIMETTQNQEAVLAHLHSQVANLAEAHASAVKIRSIAVVGPIGEETSVGVLRNLFQFEAESKTDPIVMFLNTPGGSVYDAFAIYDVMKSIECPITTVGLGRIMSAGVLILSAGDKGHRYACPNSYLMTHDIQTGMIGGWSDVDSQHKHTAELRDKFMKLLSQNSSLSYKEIRKQVEDRESYFSATVAKSLGIVDHVSLKKPKAYFRDME